MLALRTDTDPGTKRSQDRLTQIGKRTMPRVNLSEKWAETTTHRIRSGAGKGAQKTHCQTQSENANRPNQEML